MSSSCSEATSDCSTSWQLHTEVWPAMHHHPDTKTKAQKKNNRNSRDKNNRNNNEAELKRTKSAVEVPQDNFGLQGSS